MNGNIYTYIVVLLIIRINTPIVTKHGIGAWIQFGVQPGIIGDCKQVQGLNINPQPVKVKALERIRNNIVTNSQVSAPEKRTLFHCIRVECS